MYAGLPATQCMFLHLFTFCYDEFPFYINFLWNCLGV